MQGEFDILQEDENYYSQVIEGLVEDKNYAKEYEFELQNQIDELRIKEKAMISHQEDLKDQLTRYYYN